MKNHLKVGAILIAILTVYSIIVYVIAANKAEKEKPDNNVTEKPQDETNKIDENNQQPPKDLVGDYNVILSPNTIISYVNGTWQENPKFKYENQLFDVYIGSENVGFNYLTYSAGWKVFDSNRNFLEINDNIFAMNTKLEYHNFNVTKSEINDIDKNTISEFLNSKNITFDLEKANLNKYVIDVNFDGIRDELFFVSNAFTESEESFNKAFSFGFVKYYNKTEEFYNVTEEISEAFKIGNPTLQNIIKINDNIYYIVSVEYFSNKGCEHIIYKLNNDVLVKELKTSTNN